MEITITLKSAPKFSVEGKYVNPAILHDWEINQGYTHKVAVSNISHFCVTGDLAMFFMSAPKYSQIEVKTTESIISILNSNT